MKKLLLILFIISSFNSKGTIHQIQVWNGYMQFLPPNNIIVQLGDTIQWIPLDPPTMTHTITSDNIPVGAVPFDQVWQLPADTFFQYIPQVTGLYQYVCTPHIPNGMIGEFTVVNGTTSQKTYVPDDNFEQVLINLGYDNVLDDSVNTANIDTVTELQINSTLISDLTGIEDFNALTYLQCQDNQLTSLDINQNTALIYLYCHYNQIISLDVSQNTALIALNCGNNQLISLDVRNGNNINMDLQGWSYFSSENNPNLTCIDVDDDSWSTANWSTIDLQHYFSNNCSGTAIQEHSSAKDLLKITDILGRKTKETNQPLFYIFDDGTVEKKIIIE